MINGSNQIKIEPKAKGNNILKKTEFYEDFLSEIKQVTSDMLGFLIRGSEDESP